MDPIVVRLTLILRITLLRSVPFPDWHQFDIWPLTAAARHTQTVLCEQEDPRRQTLYSKLVRGALDQLECAADPLLPLGGNMAWHASAYEAAEVSLPQVERF